MKYMNDRIIVNRDQCVFRPYGYICRHCSYKIWFGIPSDCPEEQEPEIDSKALSPQKVRLHTQRLSG